MKLFSRKQYLNNECTHAEYYNQFVTETIKSMVAQRFGKMKLSKSFKQDEHLNNIPLKEWDNASSLILMSIGIRNQMKELGDSMSMSGAVCILKAAAKMVIDNHDTEPQFELKHKEELLFSGTENECYFKLQKVQSQSADWAMKHEGYTITSK